MTRGTRVSGPRLWLGTVVLVVAVLAGVRTIGVLVAPGAWWSTAIWVVLPVALLVAVLRQLVRSRLAPTAWGLLAAALAVAAWYGDPLPGLTVPRPTPETVERLRLLIDSGVQAIADGRIPVQPTRGIELLVVAGAVLAYLVAELFALGFGRGALAGLPLVALWAPAISFERDPGLGLAFVTGTCYLMLLVLTRRRSRRNDRTTAQELPVAAAAAAGLAAVALVLTTATTALPFHGSVTLPSGWGAEGIDSPLRISTDLDMRADLEDRSDRTLLRYRGDGSVVDALRMYSLSDFDGVRWQPDARQPELHDADGLLWPDPDVQTDPEKVKTLDVEVLALNQDRLPVPTEPRTVDVGGGWLYDAQDDEVVATRGTTRGLSFSIEVHPRGLTADELRRERPGRPGDGGTYLDVPDTPHAADIKALAERVVDGTTNTYDAAVALQSFLRNAQEFRYSTDVPPPRSDDAVWDFLTDRQGYCVQYATTMTIMARMLGIPARMAVGFLPGRADGDVVGQYLVSARQAHTWPELYFEDAGWVRFEPTPARQTGAPPLYADPFAGQPNIPGNIPTAGALPNGAATPGQATPGGSRAGYVTLVSADVPVSMLIGTSAALLLVTAGLVVMLVRRRRTLAHAPHDAEEWWARLRERLAAHGIVWSDATTPRQAARAVADRLPSPLDADPGALVEARASLDELVAALETERYTTRPVGATPDQLGEWVDAVERPLGTPVTAQES